MKFVTRKNFVTLEEIEEINSYYNSFPREKVVIENNHIKEINEATNGWTILCDLTKTDISIEVSKFQGDATCVEDVPNVLRKISDRIAYDLKISSRHVFVQYISVGSNGEVRKHYDAGKPGYVTYKCNVCLDGPDLDYIYVDSFKHEIDKFDLYCFEANLYKHWMDKSSFPRIHLSYGFIIPYDDLGWYEDHPRIRLSNRIWKNYIK